jgi:hypothetical protein
MLAERLGSPMTSIMCVGAPAYCIREKLSPSNIDEPTGERLAEHDLELSRRRGCDHARHLGM